MSGLTIGIYDTQFDADAKEIGEDKIVADMRKGERQSYWVDCGLCETLRHESTQDEGATHCGASRTEETARMGEDGCLSSFNEDANGTCTSRIKYQ